MSDIPIKVFRSLFILLLIIGVLAASACRKDFEYRETEGRLEFSKDTVYLDTVFTNISSSTYSLKVYNRTGDDIIIPTLTLEQGNSSNYRLNVDGIAGKVFNDVTIMARDSMFIFIETTFDISQLNQNEFLYTDELQFVSSTSLQQVPLVTLVKDAVFLFPSELADGTTETIVVGQDENGDDIRVEGFVLNSNQLNFTNEKPYVIYGYAAVDDGNTLNIDAGARVHFHKDSGLLMTEGASLQVNGSLSEDHELLENEVIFEGDRLEPEFAEVAAQWGTIWLAPGSVNHRMNYCTIRNATVGLLVEGRTASEVTLNISNTQIYNSGTVNLWGRGTRIEAENLVLGSAGTSSLLCDTGGHYKFLHTTVANYWSDSFRTGPAVGLSNFGTNSSGSQLSGDLELAQFSNFIIDGNTSRELILSTNGSDEFNYNFSDGLIKFNDLNGQFADDPLYDFENTTLYLNIVLNGEADFLNTARNDFRIGMGSEARDIGSTETANLVPLDLLGNDRLPDPDSGAFEFVPE